MRNICTKHLRQALLCAALVTTATLGASAASAHVGTYVSNYSALSGNSNFAGYNFTRDQFFNVGYGSGGAFTYTACRADVPCSHTGGGTPGTNGDVTSSFSFATMGDTDQGGPSTGGGFARADLATGELGASADGAYRAANGQGSGISTRAFGTLNDTLMFTIDGADASTFTDIGVNVEVHGMMSQVNPFTGGSAYSYLNFGGGVFGGTLRFDGAGGTEFVSGANYWQSYAITRLADGFAFSGVYALRGATTSVDVGQFLDVSCGNGATCDYSHTSHLALDLPDNVTFTSASGAFLTQAGAMGVPEPASWALMILGFGGMGQVLRRRRAVVLSMT